MRILLVEDDHSLGAAVAEALVLAGNATDWVKTAAHALHAIEVELFDLVILDLGLPDQDGLHVVQKIRSKQNLVPILILTARDAIDSRVKGLDLGADDYLVKPVAMAELCARARALLRRVKGAQPRIVIGKLELDIAGKQVCVDGKQIELSAREWSVLEYLAIHADKIVSKEQLIQAITNWSQELSLNAIEAYVHRLRGKLTNSNVDIRTVRGLGYLLSESRA